MKNVQKKATKKLPDEKKKTTKRENTISVKNILFKILFIFLVIVCLFIIYYIVSVKVYRNTGYKYKPYISMQTIMSESMKPKFSVYDVVVERLVSKDKIKIGDIITYVDSNDKSISITHRVVDIYIKDDKYYYKTKGDNNKEEDSNLVSYDQVLGTVMFKIPLIGKMQFLL